jgi:hypothetical protein
MCFSKYYIFIHIVFFKKTKKIAVLCLMISAIIFIITYFTDRNSLFNDVSNTLGKENKTLTEDDVIPEPVEVNDNLSVTPCYPDNSASDTLNIVNDYTSNEDVQSISDEDADNASITPTPEDVEDQAMQQAIKEQWYMFKRLFVSEDGLHTFHLGWYDDGTLWCVFDDNFYAASVENVDNTSLGESLVYEGSENGGSIKIIYNYDEEKIVIIDLLGLDKDYSGIYNLDEASVIEPDFN